jgi:hypothetical protein
MIARLLCTLLFGHRWETVADPAGSFLRCTRCGTLQHERTVARTDATEGDDNADFPGWDI